MSLGGVRVLLGVSGGVACYKAVSLARGLVKAGGSHSRSAFDTAVAGLTPGGGTPLAEVIAGLL